MKTSSDYLKEAGALVEKIDVYWVHKFITESYKYAASSKLKKFAIASLSLKFCIKQLKTQSHGWRSERINFALGNILKISPA